MNIDRRGYFLEYRSRPEVKERQKQHQTNWRKGHPEKALLASRNNRIMHKEKRNEYARKKYRARVAFMDDYYIAFLIKRQTKYLFKTEDIPKDLIDIQRKMLFINRKLKQTI